VHPKKNNFKKLRNKMVQEDLKGRDISDKAVLQAMSKVPREEFLPDDKRTQAYEDHPVEIGYGQTISQPYIVALMCQLLNLSKSDKVLDIGTGLGYEAAVLSEIVEEVVTVEIIDDLAREARDRLKKNGFANVEVVNQNGRKGYSKKAPYDAIKVAAATREIPQVWKDQLKVGGRILVPLKKGRWGEDLMRLTKKEKGFRKESFGAVAFVPLVHE
jgi:protein-L-isoaspartate(D-aspartate) O-methyltransferase